MLIFENDKGENLCPTWKIVHYELNAGVYSVSVECNSEIFESGVHVAESNESYSEAYKKCVDEIREENNKKNIFTLRPGTYF